MIILINKDEVKRILITRTDRLGDVILTLPLITEVKKVFKHAKIMFFVKNYTVGLLTGYDGIDEILTEEDAVSFSEKYNLFKSKDPDLVINVKPRFDLALIFSLLRTKYRVGTGYRWFSFLYNCKVYQHRKTSDKHESDLNLNLLSAFFDGVSTEKKFFFSYNKEDEIELNKKLEIFKLSPEDKYIILHPGSGGSAKDLPKERYSEFIDLFSDEFSDHRIVITGLENETALAEDVIKNSAEANRVRITDLTGKLSLKELMILTDHSQLFISNSTGPIHLAGALNKKIIGFYPNERHMSDVRWGPLGNNSIILRPDLNSVDMSSIRAEDILNASKKLLN
jgi:ADP-heptose:LPS heptosyltransferase